MKTGTGFLANIFAGKGAEIIESVGDVVGQFVQTKEEKDAVNLAVQAEVNRHMESMQSQANDELKLLLADTSDARLMNTKVQESDKASWLSKNIAYMLDLFVGLLWGTITVILFLKVFKVAAGNVDMISLMALHGTVTAVFMISMNFHRGSSIGSERKQKQIEKMQH